MLPANDLFCPLGGDDYIVYSDDIKKTQAEFARFSRHDADIYPQFARQLEQSADIVRKLLFETPVDPVKRSWKSFKQTAALLWRHRNIGDRAYRLDRPADAKCLTTTFPSGSRMTSSRR